MCFSEYIATILKYPFKIFFYKCSLVVSSNGVIFSTYLVRFEVMSNHLFEFEIQEETKALTAVLLDFSLTVKAAPHECVIRTGQP